MDNEGNIVIPISLDNEAVHKPAGFFTKICSMTSKIISKVSKKDHPLNSEPKEEEIPQSTPPPSNLSLSLSLPEPSQSELPNPPMAQELEINNPIPRTHLHPIIKMTREQELGKAVLNLGVPAAIAVLIFGGGKPLTVLIRTKLIC